MTGYKPLEKLSISRILDYERCPIYFYRRAVCGEPTPSTGSQELGIALHDLAEHYLRDGRQPHDGKPGALLRAGLHLLPVIGSVVVEGWIGLDAIGRCDAVPAGVPLTGKVDYYAPPGPTSPAAWSHYTCDPVTRAALAAFGGIKPHEVVFVGDHKTTSDLRYAKPPEKIALDPQLSVYAHAIAAGVKATPRAAVLEHVQYRTRGIPVVQRSRAVVPWSTIEATVAKVDASAARALTLARVLDRDTVITSPANARPAACGDYGGCPFKASCAFSPDNRANPTTTGRIPTMQTPTAPAPIAAGAPASSGAAARRAALFAGSNAAAPSVNPPDAAPPSPAVDPMVGFEALGEALEMTGGDRVTEAYARKLITRVGCSFEEVLAIVDERGAFVLDGGFVVLTDAAPAAPATPATAAPVEAFDVVEFKHGEWRVYDSEGNAIRAIIDGKAVFKFASREAAVASLPPHGGGVPVPPAPPLAPRAPAATPAAPAATPAAPAASTPLRPYHTAPAWSVAPVDNRAAVDAIVAKIEASETELDGRGTLATGLVDVVIKGALNLARLRGPTRDAVINLGEQVGAFVRIADGLAEVVEVGDVRPETAAEAALVERSNNAARSAIAATPTPAQVAAIGTAAASPANLAQRIEATPAAPAATPAAPAPTPAAPASAQPLVVLVDCLPASSGVFFELATVLAPLEDEVAAEAGVAHYGLIDFGKGPKSVASKFLISCTRSRLEGVFVISSSHPCAGEVVAILQRFGAYVVRGVRS